MNAGPPHPQLTFKRAGAGDVETFAALEGKSASRTYGPPGTREDALREIAENTLYLISQGDIVIGTVAYRLRPDHSVYISCLNVDPAWRRRGVARAAINHVLLQTDGAPRIDLVTHPDNDGALQVYVSLGFRVESRQENYFGDGEPRLVLAKDG